MKKITISIALVSFFSMSYAQSTMDSIKGMASLLTRNSVIFLDANYQLSVHSNNDIHNYFHQKGTLLLNLNYKRISAKLGIGIENLSFRTERHSSPFSYNIQYLTLPIIIQYQVFDFQGVQLYLGAGYELDWIVDYHFTNEGANPDHPTARNPEIYKGTGDRLVLPLTCYFSLSEHCRCFVNVSCRFQMLGDHADPTGPNHWGVITPERELDTGMPLWIGLGLSYKIKSKIQD